MTKHVWMDYPEQAEDIRHTPKYRELYDQRKETIERVFADAKEKYGMRYTPYRGLSQVTNWVRLKFAAMNLKKYAIHKWKDDFHRLFLPISQIERILCGLIEKIAPESGWIQGFFYGLRRIPKDTAFLYSRR